VKLNTKGRYAVMAMVDLAKVSEEYGGGPIVLADIAERQEISLSYLEQLFSKLRKSGLVSSTRGPGGGYRLSRPTGKLRISDIMAAVDEPIHATRCKHGTGKECMSDNSRCLTHDLWDELSHEIHRYLSSVTLEDVCESRVRERGSVRPAADPVIVARG
jgi:Rrf2 family iron-sulfur cluster assembly transcriptional regulator